MGNEACFDALVRCFVRMMSFEELRKCCGMGLINCLFGLCLKELCCNENRMYIMAITIINRV